MKSASVGELKHPWLKQPGRTVNFNEREVKIWYGYRDSDLREVKKVEGRLILCRVLRDFGIFRIKKANGTISNLYY